MFNGVTSLILINAYWLMLKCNFSLVLSSSVSKKILSTVYTELFCAVINLKHLKTKGYYCFQICPLRNEGIDFVSVGII